MDEEKGDGWGGLGRAERCVIVSYIVLETDIYTNTKSPKFLNQMNRISAVVAVTWCTLFFK